MKTSGKKYFLFLLLFSFIGLNENIAQRFNINTSTDCGNLNIKFSIQGGLAFCEGDTITLINTTDSIFDYYVIDWSHGKLDTVYDKKNATHVYYFPDSVLCKAPPLAVYFLGVKNCANGKQTRVWGAYGINHIYRPLASFTYENTSICQGKKICLNSKACNADSIVWIYENKVTSLDSCYTFNSSGTKTITMMAYNKCAADTVTRSFDVVEYPSAKVNVSTNVKNNSVCKGDTVLFINQSNQWSSTYWVLPAINDKIWKLDTAISNLEKSLPYDTIIYLDTLRFIVLDTGIIKFRLNSSNPCDTINWDYNLKVVESAILKFITPKRFCETADYSPEIQVIGDIDRYSWSFPGGNPSSSNLQNPTNIQYSNPGVYTIILRATNSCGTSIDSVKLFVDPKPLLKIDSIQQPICKSRGLISLKSNLPNGKWSGFGIDSNGTFDASKLAVGSYDFVYTLQSLGCLLMDTIHLTISDSTVVDLTPLNVCLNTLPTQIIANPPGGIFSGPGINGSGLFDPLITGIGMFTVRYVFSDANTCHSRANVKVIVDPPPKINKKDTIKYCVGSNTINLFQDFGITANPTGGKYTFSLNGKGVNPIFNSFGYSAGVYTLLINYQIDLCFKQDTAYIIFLQAPVLHISNDTILCDRNGIIRLKTSHPGGIWNGPSINPATGLIDLIAIGTDTAIYTYTYSFGLNCQASKQCTIIIDDKGKGIYAGKNIELCRDSTSTFRLGGFSPAGGKWTGDGILQDSLGFIHLPSLLSDTNYTFYYCLEKAFNSPCTFCDSLNFIIHSPPLAEFDILGSACLNMEFTVSNTSLGAKSYFWDFGDQKSTNDTSSLFTPKYRYTDTGIHMITLKVTNAFGCSHQYSKIIHVTPNPPIADFSLDSMNGCAPFYVSLKNNSRGDNISYLWKVAGNIYQDSLPNIIIDGITKDTSFLIELSVMNGCGMVSDSNYITVRPYPIVNFGVDSFSGCTPLEINFSNTSVGNVDQFVWDMGNGNIYTDFNPPKQIYTTTDSMTTLYQIKLIGINECGSDTLIKEIKVNPSSVLAFIEVPSTKICQYDSLLLKSFSTPGSSVNWKIKHPSGLISTANTVQTKFRFDSVGIYTIILHAKSCGEDFDTVYIQVLPAPKVNFNSPLILCLNDTAFFTNLSLDIIASEWDFGDPNSPLGNTSKNTHTFHRFSAPGKYTIRLTGYSLDNNCPHTISKELIVIGAPEAKFAPSKISGCAPLQIDFFNLSIGATKYNWTFSDNSSNSLLKDPSHAFLKPGSYPVILQVLDSNQCFSDTAIALITVYPSPKSEFSFDKNQYCLAKDSVFIINQSTGSQSFLWNIENGNSTEINPGYFPLDSGLIHVRLISTNVFLCSDTIEKTVLVIPSPKSAFSPDKNSGCEDLNVQLTNLSTHSDTWVWDFGDGNSSIQKSPEHLFKNPGSIIISLISYGNNGCPPDTARQTINVWPLPDANFIIQKDSLCGVPMNVKFINNSTSAVNFQWSLDGQLVSTNAAFEHVFTKTGNYSIDFKIASNRACLDSTTKSVSIFEKPIADFILNNEACQLTPIKLNNLSQHAKNYEWFIEGLGYSNEFEPEISFLKAGEYDIQLIVSYNTVCKDTLLKSKFIKIYQQPEADFSFELDVDKSISGDVQFTNLSKNYTHQKWFFGDGLFTIIDNPLHIYSINQAINATLYVYHHNGGLFTCVDSISKSIGPLWITTFFAPNALSPEYGDGDVRVFKPVGLGIETYEISVYSPWGERVWYSDALIDNSPSEFWDGRYQGSIVPQGSYTWLAKLGFINGNKKIAKGTVTVLR